VDYNVAAPLDPQFGRTYYLRSHAHHKLGDLDAAVADLTRAIQLKALPRESYLERAAIHVSRMEYSKALKDLNSAARLGPGDWALFQTRGMLNAYEKKFDKGYADIAEALRLAPDKIDPIGARGMVHFHAEKYADAVADLSTYLAVKQNVNYTYFRGRAYQHLKEYAKARDDYLETVRVNPEEHTAHNQAAWVLAACPDDAVRDGPRAVELAARACELSGWKDMTEVDTLAAAHAEVGNFHKAVELMQRCLREGLPQHRNEYRARLQLFQGRKPYRFV